MTPSQTVGFQSLQAIKRVGEIILNTPGKTVLVTDENLKALYQDEWVHFFQALGRELILVAIPPGESSKTRKTKEMIEDHLFSNHVGRDGLLIAFGGGVVTDLVGYIAATYMRGIPYVSIPTTLMGMVDAAIGGKTGINTPFGKNTLGVINPPDYLSIDSEFLETLPKSELKNGFIEVLKYGLIYDLTIFKKIEANRYSLSELIPICREIKEEIVTMDPYDFGLRRILNFGHTVGHAIELDSGYEVSHGTAVWMGIRCECLMSYLLGSLSRKNFERIDRLLLRNDIFFHVEKKFSEKNLYEVMKRDKKSAQAVPRFVTIQEIGEVEESMGEYVREMPWELFSEAMSLLDVEQTRKGI